MRDQINQASEALASRRIKTPAPAVCGCPRCGEIRMIVSPALPVCARCGETLQVLDAAKAVRKA